MFSSLTDFLNTIGIAAPGRMGWLTVILTFVLASLAAWLFIPRLRVYALEVGWADEPNARRLNQEPLPNAGGLAIFAAVIAALVLATLLRPIVIEDVKSQILSILLGGSFLIIAGFIDDQFGLPPLFRLLVQILATLLLVATGIKIQVTFGGAMAETLSVLLTVIWIVAITNAVNLMDGVDGLAGGISFITAMSLLAVSAQDESRAAATLLLAALGGAALGFLRHNFPPSRIIMGDSGAYFFGFVLAASGILGDLKVNTIFALIPTVLFLLLPVLDTGQVIIRRLLRRQNPLSTPGQDHLHHGLLALGFSQRRTSLVLWGISLGFNILAMARQGMSVIVIVTTVVGIVVLLAATLLKPRKPLPAPSETAPAEGP